MRRSSKSVKILTEFVMGTIDPKLIGIILSLILDNAFGSCANYPPSTP